MVDGEFDNLTVNNILTIGADTILYRGAADTLKTDDKLQIYGGLLTVNNSAGQAGVYAKSAGTESQTESYLRLDNNPSDGTEHYFYLTHKTAGELKISSYKTGDAWHDPIISFFWDDYITRINQSGKLEFGTDVDLYRSAADVLKTDDNFSFGGTVFRMADASEGQLIMVSPYSLVWNHYMPSWTGHESQKMLVHSWTGTLGDFIYICATGNNAESTSGALIISGSGLRYGFGHADGNQLTTETMYLTADGQLQLPVPGSSGGIVLGTDTNLYRGADDTLKTENQLWLNRAGYGFVQQLGSNERCIWQAYSTHASPYLRLEVSDRSTYWATWDFLHNGDFRINSGKLFFSTDVNLYRSASNTLATGNILESREHWQHLSQQDFMDAVYNHTFADTTGKIKFYDLEAGNNYVLLHGVLVGDPFLVCSQHLAVEKDLLAKGMLNSLEGEVSLNGGSYGPGWGPYTRNPFIWLAQENYNTLEIRKSVENGTGDWDYNHEYQMWGWGDLACGTIKSAGSLYLTGNDNGYLWNNGGYIRQSGGNGFVADGTISIGSVLNLGWGSGTRGPLYVYGSTSSYGGTICVNTSSQKYKENIENLSDCSWIYDLRPVYFDWKDQNRAKEEGRQLGLIAEEVNELCPQLTWLDSEGRPEGVHYEWLGVPLIVELKKLRTEVADLRQQMKKLTINIGD